jgi:hypothetical protein
MVLKFIVVAVWWWWWLSAAAGDQELENRIEFDQMPKVI